MRNVVCARLARYNGGVHSARFVNDSRQETRNVTDPQDQSRSVSASAGRAEPNEQQRRYREFLDLMPLMLSLEEE